MIREKIRDKIDDILYDIQCFFKDKLSHRCRKCPAFTSGWNAFENDGDCGCVFKDDYTCMWDMDDLKIMCAWWILPRCITSLFAEKQAQKKILEEAKKWEEYTKTLTDEF